MTISVILTFLIFLFLLKDRLLVGLLFFPLVIYFLSYDLRDSFEVKSLMVNKSFRDYTNYLIYGLILYLTTILLLLIDRKIFKNINSVNRYYWDYSLKRLKIWFYLISILTLLGSIINFSHVNYSFDLLLLNPRDYEFAFGSSTFINYLYFLAPVAICLGIYLKDNKQKLRFGWFVFLLLFLSSLLHGVKFTVFDTILIPSFFYFYVKKRKVGKRLPLIIFSILLIFYLLFSTFIRGAGESPLSQVLSYILPNFVNLANSLNDKVFQWEGLSIIIPDKMPGLFNEFYILSDEGFVLNDLYNMQTAYLNYYRFAWYLGPFLFLLPVLIIRRYLINIWSYDLRNLFVLALIDYCLLFIFFFHAFTKTKYWYLVFVLLIVHYTSKKTRLLFNE